MDSLFEALAEAADGAFVINNDQQILYWNRSAQELLGYAPDEAVGRSCYEVLEGRDSQGQACCHRCSVIHTAISGSPVTNYDTCARTKSGEMRDVRVTTKQLSIGGKSLNIAMWQDITERKRAEQAIKESEEKYRSLFEEARDGIVLIDALTGTIVDCNPEFERQTGRELNDLLGMRIWQIRPEDNIELSKEMFFKFAEIGHGGSSELPFERPDGSIVPIEFESRKVIIGGKEYMQSMTRDISERLKADQALRRSERFSRTTINSMIDPLHVVDRDLKVLLHNDRLSDWTST